MQRTGRLAGDRIALDATIGGIRGVGIDAGQRQGGRVDPGPVHVAVEQERRPAAENCVEVFLARCPAREMLHRPPAADDPLV